MTKLKFLALGLLAPLAAPTSSFGQAFKPGLNVQDTNPEPVKVLCWNGSAYAACPSSASDASITETHATAGSDATKAEAVQGITGGKPVVISDGSGVANSLTVDCAGAACALAPQTYQLLTNASTSGATVANIAGGGYFVDISGTFGGTTATLQYTDSSGSWQTSGTCTAYCALAVTIGQNSSVRVLLTGGTPSAIYATMRGVGGPINSAGSGGGGGGDASAANQTLQITQETALNTVFGTAVASPTQYTVSDRLKTINTTLGGLMPSSGGTVGISGTLPAFAAIPTFKIDQTTPGTTDSVSIKNDDGHKGEVGGNQNPTTVAQTVTPNGAAIGSTSGSSTTLTIASTSVGSIIVGSALTCTGCTTGTTVTAIGTYSAGAGTVTMSAANTIAGSTAITFTQPYASGMAVGGLMTVANAARISGKSSFLQSLIANIKSAQTIQIDIFMFNANPTGSTCTDRTAFSLAAADFDKVKGVVHITDWTAAGTPSVGQAQNLAMPMHMTSGTSVWQCAVTRGASIYTATTDVSLSDSFVRD